MRSATCILLALLLSTPMLLAQDVDTIVARGLEALGGVARLKSVQSRSFAGDATFNGGMASGTFTWVQKRPDKIRLEFNIDDNTLVQAAQGSTAWQIQPAVFGGSGLPESLDGPAADSVLASATFESPLIDYKKKGNQVELVGEEEFEGRPVYRLKVTRKNGRVNSLFLDKETFLGVKLVTTRYNPQTGADAEVVQLISDYKDVDGIKVPHTLEVLIGGQSINYLTITSAELNAKLDDNLFEMPTTEE